MHTTTRHAKRQTPKLGTAARLTCSGGPEFSSDGFASPSFEGFAFIIPIGLNLDYRRRIRGSLGHFREFAIFFLGDSSDSPLMRVHLRPALQYQPCPTDNMHVDAGMVAPSQQ